MTVASMPSLNGFAPSWADAAIKFGIYEGSLLEIADIKDISVSDSLTIGVQRAPGGRKRKRTTGELDNDASMTLYRAGLRNIASKLADVAPKRDGDIHQIGLVGFDIIVSHTPPGESAIFKIEIRGCRLSGRDWKMAEGPDAELVTVALNPMDVIEFDEKGRKIALI